MDENLLYNNSDSRYCALNNPYIKNETIEHSCDCLKIGDKAPDFVANTTFGECKLSDFKGKWLVFFCHPGDFTPVCTTEFISFSKYHSEFKKKNCELLGLSVDNIHSHLAWVYDIYKSTGVQVSFPIIEDKDGKIAKMYNMLDPSNPDLSIIRAVYIICPEGKIKAILLYPSSAGRNIGEILRLVEAIQENYDNNQSVTPANWIPGTPTLSKPPKTQDEMMSKLNNSEMYNCSNWYLCTNNKPMKNMSYIK